MLVEPMPRERVRAMEGQLVIASAVRRRWKSPLSQSISRRISPYRICVNKCMELYKLVVLNLPTPRSDWNQQRLGLNAQGRRSLNTV